MTGRSRGPEIDHRDVGMHEVAPFEEKWLSRRGRECVREALAVIQACAMPALSEAAECAARHFAVFRVDWNELNARSADEVIQVAQSFGACRASMTMEISTNVATDIRQASAASMASMKARRSGSRCRWQRERTCR